MKKKAKLHKVRNLIALNPLLRKGGLYEQEDIDVVRKRVKREQKLKLKKIDWLKE